MLIERHAPGWFDAVVQFDHTTDGITYRLRDLYRPDYGLVAATMEYSGR